MIRAMKFEPTIVQAEPTYTAEMRPVRWLMDPKVPAVMGARRL